MSDFITFNWPYEEKIFRGLIAMCMLNQHKTNCSKHEVYWSKQVKESSDIFKDFSEYCSTSIRDFLPEEKV